MDTATRIKPQGFFQTLRAKLEWIWNPQEAERRYDFDKAKPAKRILSREMSILLLPRPGEAEGARLSGTLTAETVFAGGWTFRADGQMEIVTDRFLERAGQHGVTVDGVFYPHSRIDRIEPGPVKVIAEGCEG